MIRIFKLLFLLVISQVAFAQAPSNYTNINGRYRWIAGMFDSTFHIPKGTTPSLRTGGSTNAGGLFYNTSDSSVYTYTGTQWIKVRGSLNPSDTTNKYVTQVYKKSGSDSVFYVKGGVHTWAFNDSTGAPGGGGGGKVYYFNGGVSMGTFGGFTMYELGDTANTGAAANFTRATTGNIANFITDPGKPGLLQIPAGVWTIDAYLNETGGGSNSAEIYVQVEKWDGSTITTIATSPIEQITNGNVIDLYTWSVSIPTTALAVTDRIIIQFYIQNTNGKTVTLYTQNGYVGEVHTTFTTGIGAINGLTAPAQYLVTGTSGTDFNINSTTATHTFNLPTASATNRGALSSADWTTFNNKGSVSSVATNTGTGITGGTITTSGTLAIDTLLISTRAWRQKGIDSVASLVTSGYVPSSRTITINGTTQDLSANRTYNVGTVTSVATNTGTGITGGTFTTSGTIAADTLLLSTRAWRQKGIDSVASLINTRISGTTNYIPKFTSSSAIGNSDLRTDASNNLGLGVTPSAWGVGFEAFEFNALGTLAASGSAVLLQNNSYNNGTNNIRKAIGEASSYSQSGGAHIWQTAASGTSGSTISFSESMRIAASGNVGIGVSNPDSYNASAYRLVVGGLNNSGITIVGDASEGSSNLYFADGTTGDQAYRGYVTYTHSTDAMTLGTAATTRMTISNTGNLGLGVTPSAWGSVGNTRAMQYGTRSSIYEAYAGTAIASNTYFDGTNDRYIVSDFASIFLQLNGQHRWYTAPSGTAGNAISFTQAMTLDASGRLGVGTTSPEAKIHSYGTASRNMFAVSTVSLPTSGDEEGVAVIKTNSSLWQMSLVGYAASSKGLRIYNNGGTGYTSFEVAQAAGTRFIVNGDGNVGIGTTSPRSVSGFTTLALNNATNGGLIDFLNNGTLVGQIFNSSSVFDIGSITSVPLVFRTGDGERMRITSGGDAVIGTTSASGRLHVRAANATSSNFVIYLENSAATELLKIRNDGAFFTGTGSSSPYNNTSGSAANLVVTSAGTLERSTSSLKYKKNVVSYDKGLSYVMQMNPVYYESINEREKGIKYAGLIAEEIHSLGLTEFVQYAKDGTPDALSYQNMVALLTKAIQEQQAQIEQLKTAIETLKNK
jgi:hypothetical protein